MGCRVNRVVHESDQLSEERLSGESKSQVDESNEKCGRCGVDVRQSIS